MNYLRLAGLAAGMLMVASTSARAADPVPCSADDTPAKNTRCGVGSKVNNGGGDQNNSAFGYDADAAGGGANTAIGAQSDASGGLGNVAIGFQGDAAGGSSHNIAIGSSFAIEGIPAANASGDVALNIAVGTGANASGTNGANIAIGGGASASGADQNLIAIGLLSSSTGASSVALGTRSVAAGDSSVALGEGSIATEADTVSVGSADLQRRIVNVAAGTSDTDAANVAQLNVVKASAANAQVTADTAIANAATAQSSADQANAGVASVAQSLGGGVSYDPATGAYTAPSYTVAGQAYDTVGGALGAVDSQLTTLSGKVDGVMDLAYSIRREERRGIAAVAAMTTAPMPSEPGRTSWTANTAVFRGEVGFGGALAHRFDTAAPLALTAGFAYAPGGNSTARVGMAGEF